MKRIATLIGHPRPRIGPPIPLRHGLAEYRQAAADLSIDPMAWQETVAKFLTAKGPDGLWLYREVAAVVGRQNGKTTLTKPLIVARLKAGRRLMHIAQVRELPRIMFEAIADALEDTPELFPKRRGKIIWPRRGAGSESIVLTNGGEYRIAAAITGGRGFSFDDLLIDELREMDSYDVVNSAKPAQRFAEDPQTIYLSNMGTEKSVILNSLRKRAGYDPEHGWVGEPDPSLAYLEWSADPEYDAGDQRGWVQSNPSIGPDFPQVLRDLEKDYLAAQLGGNMAGFETEALCRSVPSMRERLVDEGEWMAGQRDTLEPSRKTYMAVSMDPAGTRASAAAAWLDDDGGVSLKLLREGTGSPIAIDALGADLRILAGKVGARDVGFDPLTDGELAKFFKKTTPLSGNKWANASATFARLVRERKLRWVDCESVTADLVWTAKKDHDESGSFQAVRADDDRPITAALAAIRAVYLASGPKPSRPRIY